MSFSQEELRRIANLPFADRVRELGLRPSFEICDLNVAEPTLKVVDKEFESERQRFLAVQWFGEGDGIDPSWQFDFQLPISLDDPHFHDDPEKFRLVYLGKAKDFPTPRGVQTFTQVAKGNKDGWVVYVISGHFGVQSRETGEWGPVTFAFPFNIMLADPEFGVIMPKPYTNLNVVSEEEERVHNRHKRYKGE